MTHRSFGRSHKEKLVAFDAEIIMPTFCWEPGTYSASRDISHARALSASLFQTVAPYSFDPGNQHHKQQNPP